MELRDILKNPVSAEQYLHVMQLGEFLVVDGDEAHLLQPFAFLSVVHDVA